MRNNISENPEVNKARHFAKQTTKELEKELDYLLRQDKIGGFDEINVLDELFKRRYAETDEIEKLIKLLKTALVNYKTKDRYKHYHCNEKIIATFKDKIKKATKPTEEDIMCFVSCLNAFYSAGLNFEKDKSGIEKMTSFINVNWTSGLKLKEQLSVEEVNPLNIQSFCAKSPLSRNMYSFITKVYHQFNSDYPIYDSKLEKLLILLFPKIKHSVYKAYPKYYNIFCEVLLKNLNRQNLKMDVNDFDNAAWILIKEKEEELKAKGKKLTLESLLK
jgi:hypothetical protein